MLTPKIPHTNLKKTTEGWKVGYFARSHQWGTRVYKVVSVNHVMQYEKHRGGRRERGSLFEGLQVTLVKVGETNKGRFRFTNGRPFTIYEGDTLSWYYPAKGI